MASMATAHCQSMALNVALECTDDKKCFMKQEACDQILMKVIDVGNWTENVFFCQNTYS